MNYGLEYIRHYYNLPFLEIGTVFIFRGDKQTITGKVIDTHNASVIGQCIGSKEKHYLHPTWRMTYLDNNNNVVAEFKD